MRRLLSILTAVPLCIALGACGDDDPASDGPDAAAYCAAAAELESSATEPTEEQFDQIVSVAPEEIRDDVAALVEANRTREFPPDIETHEANLVAWEAENCGDTFGGEQEEPADS